MTRKIKKNERKKILFGTVDIGFRIEQYEKFLAQHFSNKIESESLSIFVLPKEHYKTAFTHEFSYFDRKTSSRYFLTFKNFLRFFRRFDIFHFLSGETLLTRKLRPLEFKIYKSLGKKIVLQFVGSDIRSEEFLIWKDKNLKEFLDGKDDFPKTKPDQRKLIADARKYADHILVSTPDLIELIPEAIFYPVTLNLERFFEDINKAEPYPKDSDEIVILHVPSNKALKGTDHIKNVLEKYALKTKRKVRIIIPERNKETSTNLVYTMTRYELFRLFKTADIVIDQLLIGWYGLQSVEALAIGKEVICHIDKNLEKYLYSDCPIHNADLNTLENKVEECIERIILKKTNPSQQLDWVKKYHTIEHNHEELIKAWELK